ncbi:transcriptional regulator TbsP [Halosegnis longus]|uniref:transcriptional regulator TbsP n=1 Tax=Halosegnis longus TaxID=2216012 RepID=UPI00096A6CC0
METNVFGDTVDGVLGEVLGGASDEVFLVNPTVGTLEALLDVLDTATVRVNVLAAESQLKELSRDFKLASRAADYEDDGRLTLSIYDEPANTVVVTESFTTALVAGGSQVAGLTTTEEGFVDATYDRYAAAFEDANAFDLRTPGTTHVSETLAESLGEQTAADFEAALAAMETARGDGTDLSEVTVALLVAARNEQLLYDISKWGEDTGVASKATFSRTKTDLEERGIIDTEKVPIDVGRPRLRLKLADDRLKNVSASELASVAQSVLAK